MSTALIIHPDWGARDPYGIITKSQLRAIAFHTRTWMEGWNDLAFILNTESKEKGASYAHYPVVRDYVLGMVDLPYFLACEIALWLTKEPQSGVTVWDFNPIL